MLILAILVALLVDAVAITALVALLRRSDTGWLRISAIIGTTLVVITTALVASLATVTMQSRIVMFAMARQEPMATVMATDKEMRVKLRMAVTKGLSMPGSKPDNVKMTVGAVIGPYMAYRLKTAPDRFTIASARATMGMLTRARASGADACSRVLAGDAETMRALADESTAAWMPEMLRADALDTVPIASEADSAAFLRTLAATRRWNPQDVAAASARRGPLVCDLPIAVIEAATALPQERAAAMLRRMGFGGQAVTAR